jgi:hypothetical protein
MTSLLGLPSVPRRGLRTQNEQKWQPTRRRPRTGMSQAGRELGRGQVERGRPKYAETPPPRASLVDLWPASGSASRER